MPGLPALPRLSAAARASQRRTRRHSRSRRSSRQSRQSRLSVLRHISYRMLQDGTSRWWEEMGRQSPFPSTVEQFTNSQELLVFHPRIRLLQITHYYLARFNTNVDDCKGGQDCWVCTAHGGTDARHVRFSWYYLARTIGTTGTDVILY